MTLPVGTVTPLRTPRLTFTLFWTCSNRYIHIYSRFSQVFNSGCGRLQYCYSWVCYSHLLYLLKMWKTDAVPVRQVVAVLVVCSRWYLVVWYAACYYLFVWYAAATTWLFGIQLLLPGCVVCSLLLCRLVARWVASCRPDTWPPRDQPEQNACSNGT